MNHLRQRLFVRALEDRTAPATFTVLNLNDSGADSLRDCVSKANATSGLDTVTFNSALSGTISFAGEIAISEQVNLVGTGNVTLSGAGSTRIFNISSAVAGTLVRLSDLTLVNGSVTSNGGAIIGGKQSLEVTRCIFTGHQAAGAGGAVALAGGNFSAFDCRFTGNSAASGSGGSIQLTGAAALILDGCTISGNTASLGGGVYSRDTVIIDDCTISGNTSTNSLGGGLATNTSSTTVTQRIRNSTISGNSAAGDGGGIVVFHFAASGTFTVQNCTITANTAGSGAGGGIARPTSTVTIAIESSIVSGNTNAAAPDISSAGTVNVKTSAIGSGTGFTMSNQGGNLAFGTNLKLGSLANNGGLTLTHLPSLDSPVIDAGSNPASLTTDQRGTGFVRAIGVADIGAIERPEIIVRNTADSGSGTLRQAILDANAAAGANTIAFDATVFNVPRTITLTGELPINDTLVINGPGPNLLTIMGIGAASTSNRHFNLTGAPAASDIKISGLTLTGTQCETAGASILVGDESLTLTNCVISNNSSSSFGGGVHVTGNGSSLTVRDCTFSNNTSTGGGGIAIIVGAPLLVEGSTFVGNVSTTGNSGGAIRYTVAFPANGYVIRNSTFTNNSTTFNGGALGFSTLIGIAVIQNCTIVGNSVSGKGGGGGIGVNSGTGTILLESTILANNLVTGTGTGPDLFFTTGMVTANKSLIGSSVGATTFVPDATTTSLLGSAPMLGPLANNGGSTPTYALLPGSQAINAGSNPAALTNDQRGNGFARSVGQTDIGAFEVQIAPAKVMSVQINDGSAQRSRVTSLQITFSTQVTFAGPVATAVALSRDGGGAVGGFTTVANVVGGVTVVTLSGFSAAETQFGSLADGRYTLTVLASQINNFDGNGDGTPGDNFVLTGDPATNKLFRLFGDADGDGTVAANDFIQFRLALGGSTAMFDFDGDGAVAANDFIQFRLRFGGSI